MKIDYPTWAATYRDMRQATPAFVAPIADLCTITHATIILDAGCGTGDYLNALRTCLQAAGSSPFIIGLDLSEDMLAHARDKHRTIHVVQADAQSLPFSDSSFNTIYSFDVVHLIPNLAAAYREFHRILAPHGSVCIGTNTHTYLQQLAVYQYFPTALTHVLSTFPSINDHYRLLCNAGFAPPIISTVAAHRTISAHEYLAQCQRKAYSSLHHVPDHEFSQGLERMARDIDQGTIDLGPYERTFITAMQK